METQTRKRWIAAAALAGMLALAACGGTTAGTTTQATSAPAAVATSAPAAAAAATSAPATADAPTAAAAATPAATASTAAAAAKLNLNDVTSEQLLATIPGFGSRMVREFMEYRPYESIVQFRREIGKYVDEAQVAEYEKYVYVPVDVDAADAATLQQLPGVDAAAAEKLIAARPYGSNQAFLAKLAELAPSADTTQAAAYLAPK